MSTRTIIGTTDVWLTGSSHWDIERLKNSNSVNDFTFAKHDMSDHGWIRVGTAEVSISIIANETEIVTVQVDALREQVKSIRAKAHREVSELEDKIQNLLAITYEQEVA